MTEVSLILLVSVLSTFIVWVAYDDGYWRKKRYAKILDNSTLYQRLNDTDSTKFTYKEKDFDVKVTKTQINKYYQTFNIYINDENVLTLHMFGYFISARILEYNSNKRPNEIKKIVKKSYKISKKRYNSGLTKEINEEFKTNSYFK